MVSQKKIIILGSIAFDYIMGFDENFVNAVSINHEKGEFQSVVTANSRIQHYGGCAGNISYNLGLIGAVKRKGTKKWQSVISINGKQIHIGLYATQEEAHEAYKVALNRMEWFTTPKEFRGLVEGIMRELACQRNA